MVEGEDVRRRGPSLTATQPGRLARGNGMGGERAIVLLCRCRCLRMRPLVVGVADGDHVLVLCEFARTCPSAYHVVENVISSPHTYIYRYIYRYIYVYMSLRSLARRAHGFGFGFSEASDDTHWSSKICGANPCLACLFFNAFP